MMQTAEKRRQYDGADGLNVPHNWCVLVQSEVGPRHIVILQAGKEDMAQMSFIEDDDVVETLPCLIEPISRVEKIRRSKLLKAIRFGAFRRRTLSCSRSVNQISLRTAAMTPNFARYAPRRQPD
jgi:hypothetical protein